MRRMWNHRHRIVMSQGTKVFWALLACALLFPETASSQSAYLRSPEGVLLYREISDQAIRISAPDGASELESHRDGLIELRFPDANSALAMYRSLSMTLVTPEGRQVPVTDGAIGLPFTLAFTERGYEATTYAPEFPPEFDGLPDLTRQFEDFFLPLPDEALRIGIQWTDTAGVSETSEEEEVHRLTIRQLEVTNDTIVNGVAAWVVTSRAEIELSVRSHVEELGADAISTLAGIETGWFIFSKEGVMLARRRVGDLRGRLTYILADGELPFEQSHSYTTTIQLESGGAYGRRSAGFR